MIGEEVKEEMEKDVNLHLEYFVVHNFQVEENINNNNSANCPETLADSEFFQFQLQTFGRNLSHLPKVPVLK